MADQANTTNTTDQGATAPGTPAAPPSQSTFTVPAGQRLIPETEYAQLARNNERLRGTDGFFAEAKKHGIKDFSELNEFLPLVGGLRASKADIRAIERALLRKEEAENDDAPRGGRTNDFDPAKFEQDITSKLTSTFDKRLALQQHEAAVKGEGAMISEAAKELAGPKADAFQVKQAERILRAELMGDSRPMYPADHPLHATNFAPLTGAHVKSVLDAIKKEEADSKAARLVNKADALRSTPAAKVTTSAGNPAGQGAPQDKPLNNREWLAARAHAAIGD